MTRFHHDLTIPEVYNHQVEEEKITRFWLKEKIFEKIKKSRQQQNDGKFSFHSIPTSPSDHPHSGHILNCLIKDVFKRYGYQKNYRVENSHRWDDHGFAIQFRVNKILVIKHAADFQEIGTKLYNDHCREIANEHTKVWQSVYEKLGNCVDSSKNYKTSDIKFMEGVWRVFKKLHNKGLIYRDTKTQYYSSNCFNHLSNFEAARNLKTATGIGLTITLNIVDSDEKFLFWTTNPSELISNWELYVNPKELYVKIKVKKKIYIISKKSLEFVFKNQSEFRIIEEIDGNLLQELKFESLHGNVDLSNQVTDNLSIQNDIETGISVSDYFAIQSLKSEDVFSVQQVKYKKPYCLQTETPLIRKKVDSWYIKVDDLMENLIKNINSVNWFSESQTAKQELLKWLKENPTDWSISRNRYWGTPLPIWISESGDEIVCIGSLTELKEVSGKSDISDLHRETLDSIRIPSKFPGKPPLRRVPCVFDNWFESSVLPFIWNEPEQADFVIEGNDHNQGWFYTMLVVATALDEPAPFRNVFAHGLTIESNGAKVTKRKYNHNDPMKLIEKYGADSLRLYLLSRSESNFIVDEKEVAKMNETVVQPLFRMFRKCTEQMGSPTWVNYGYITDWYDGERDPIDQWILSCTESVLKFYIEELDSNKLTTFLPKVIELIKAIEEWYLPLRCPPKLAPTQKETHSNSLSCHRSTSILYNVIYRICLVLAPVAPFVTEFIYQVFKLWMVFYCRADSMHDAKLFKPDERIIKPHVELSVKRMQQVVTMVQLLRTQHMIPMEYQIKELIMVHHSEEFRQGIAFVKDSFQNLINTRSIEVTNEYHSFGVELLVNVKSGRKQKIFKKMNKEQLLSMVRQEEFEEGIQVEDLDVTYEIKEQTDPNVLIVCSEDILLIVKMNKPLFFYEEGTKKELIKEICKLKKRKNYYPSNCVEIYFSAEDELLANVIKKHDVYINETANCKLVKRGATEEKNCVEEKVIVKGSVIRMYLNVIHNCNSDVKRK